jgi:hypothetical protein
LAGLHRTALTASSLLSLTDQTWRPVNNSQTLTVPSSPPVASAMPVYRPVSINGQLHRRCGTYWVNRNASYATLVAPENRLHDSGEGLELRRRRQLRK